MATEKKTFGEKSDELLEKVEGFAVNAIEDVKEVAKETVHDVKAKTEAVWDKFTKKN